jgi:uncharacterized protein (TIGR02996 family)
MGEREALLRAVCENPDDDLPRLVFADWLEEQGELERAEFIRGEVELDRQPGYPDDFGPEHDKLNSQLFAYLLTWTWRRDLAIGGDVEVVWARGIANILRCNSREWLASAEAVLNSHPLRVIEFDDTEELSCLEIRHEPARSNPWRLCFYRTIDDMSSLGGIWKVCARDRLVAGCAEKTAAWLRDIDRASDDSN